MTDLAWQPSAPLEHLRRRARLYADIRRFFEQRGLLEVDTPMLSAAMNPDPMIESFGVNMMDTSRYLHTSPEFPMKRLLASGSGPIWQLCRVFRRGEIGRRHNPEFTMLEWYRPGFDEHQLMQEVSALLHQQVPNLSVTVLTYREAFAAHAGFDPLEIPLKALADRTRERFDWRDDDREPMLDLWLSQVVEPGLDPDSLTYIHAWPASMAALAECTTDADGHTVARRFELFWQGMELANGYFELTDPDEQRRRFEEGQRLRARQHQHVAPLDKYLDAALANGLPASSGVALGVDRWLMALTGESDIRRVISFSADRA